MEFGKTLARYRRRMPSKINIDPPRPQLSPHRVEALRVSRIASIAILQISITDELSSNYGRWGAGPGEARGVEGSESAAGAGGGGGGGGEAAREGARVGRHGGRN